MWRCIHDLLNVCPFDCTAVARRVGLTLKPKVNNTGWITFAAQIDRPKFVRDRCVIERIVASLCNFDLHCRSFRGVRHKTVLFLPSSFTSNILFL